MNRKYLIIIGVIALIAITLFFVSGNITGNAVAEDEETLPEGFTEKCLSCPKAAECANYGACKGGSDGEPCGDHEEGEECECGNH